MHLSINIRTEGRLWLVILLPLLLLTTPSLATAQDAPRVVRVGAYQNSPKISITPDGTVSGFWPDLLEHIAHEENWEIRYVPGTWAEGIDHLMAAEIDIMPDVAYTAARAKRFTFAQSTVMMSWSRLYVRQDDEQFGSIRDLDGRTVAALKGSVNLDGPAGFRVLANSFSLRVNYLELPDYEAVFQAVESGQADAGITNRNFGNKNAARYHLKKTPLIFQPANLKFAFPTPGPNTPYLRAQIDSHLARMKQDSSSIYYRLLAQYFETDVAQHEVEVWPVWLKRVLIGAAMLLVMLGLVSFISRRQVSRKTQELRLRNEELAASESRYREIFDAPNDAIFIHELETGIVHDVNQAMLDMYELTREEALNFGPDDLSASDTPYDRRHAIAHIKDAVEKGPQIFEWHARRKSGELFWTEVSLRLTQIAGDDRIIAVVRDIEERKQTLAALAAERERLAVTLRSIGDAVITTDINGSVDLMNRIAEELTGWSAAEANGRPLDEILKLEDATTGATLASPLQNVLNSDRIHTLAPNTAMVGRDGHRRLIADSIAPIHDSQSQTIGAVLVFRDVTDQVRLEQEVLKVKKLESVGVLAGGIAHDFNNILTAILGNLGLAAEEIGPDHSAVTLLRTAETAVGRAGELTKQLLTFSRGGEPVKEAASLPQIIRESAEFVLHGSSVASHYHCQDNLWLIDSDPGQISQVVQNLVLNARHAMPQGGVLDISCDNCPADQMDPLLNLDPGDFVKLTITDHGVGIPANILERIFDPFFTTKQEGSGLGLAITYSIISQHGGHIAAASTPGQGTSFTIHLPAASRDAVLAAPPADLLTIGRSGRILIMDDEKILREVLTRMLSHLGFTAEAVSDGKEAIACFTAAQEAGEPFDLVIMDLTVPGGLGGLKTAPEILAVDPAARLVVASGYSNDKVMARFRDYGFVGALAKPTTLPDLARVVDAALS